MSDTATPPRLRAVRPDEVCPHTEQRGATSFGCTRAVHDNTRPHVMVAVRAAS